MDFTIIIVIGSVLFTIALSLVLPFLIIRKFTSPSVKIDDPVAGVLEITGISQASTGAVYQNYSLSGVLHVEGMVAQAVTHKGIVKTERHPVSGMKIPVSVSRSDPSKWRIEWDQVPTGAERAQWEAQRRADAINAESKNTW